MPISFDTACSAAWDQEIEPEIGPSAQTMSDDGRATSMGHGREPKMIIVEDAPLIALDLAETMRELGFDVQATVFTHEQARAEIQRSSPDYAVIDLHLGASDEYTNQGEALLKILSERGCRCLVFSGDEVACRRVAERYPHFSVLTKPAQPQKLAAEIEKLRLRGRR